MDYHGCREGYGMFSLSGRRPLNRQVCAKDMSCMSPGTTIGATGLRQRVNANDETKGDDKTEEKK